MGWKPRVVQECRENQDSLCRAKRHPNRLLRVTWDAHRRDWHNRSWKRHRKTQYKVEEPKEKKDSSKFAEHMARRHDFWWHHRKCAFSYSRCSYCWKHKIWEDLSKEEWKEQIAQRREKQRRDAGERWRREQERIENEWRRLQAEYEATL